MICIQTICDKLGNFMQVSLPHKLHHRACMLPKQSGVPTTNVLQGLTLQTQGDNHRLAGLCDKLSKSSVTWETVFYCPHPKADCDSPS